MQIHRSLDELPEFRNAVVTIGTFDGVHRGHQKIIQQIKREAQKHNGESVIITFYPHPRQVLAPEKGQLPLLNTLEEKILLLQKQEVDHLIVVPFTKSFSHLSATEYVRDFLVARLHPHIIVIGYDHHFGHNREGNIHLLRKMEKQYGFKVEEIPEQDIHDITISSTHIREHLLSGKIKTANELLGYPYFVSGSVIHGDERGRTLGFPTANLAVSDVHKLIPADGIYAARATFLQDSGSTDNEVFQAAVNIGLAPTFNGKNRRVEAYILDFNRSVYGEKLLLQFYDFIRPDEKFSSAEELVAQMHQDVKQIREVLSTI